jgi:hypothetical protein
MCASVRLRLLPRSHGLYLHLRAGFDRLIRFSLSFQSHSFRFQSHSLRHVPGVHELSRIQSANHLEKAVQKGDYHED